MERAGLGVLSSERLRPLLAFGAFLLSVFSGSCHPVTALLRGNASRGLRGHGSFALQAGGLFQGRVLLAQVSTTECSPARPAFHLSAHPCPH